MDYKLQIGRKLSLFPLFDCGRRNKITAHPFMEWENQEDSWRQYATILLNIPDTMNFVLFNGPSSEFGLFKNQKVASSQPILYEQKMDISSLYFSSKY
ncbi:hypothetical protein LVD13_05555 [Flavobacteriaceae bacterium D16]|nr:hypothetical protein [Flavobacteriaceae bacterium D16]